MQIKLVVVVVVVVVVETCPACDPQFTCPACEFLVLGIKIVNRMLGTNTENHTDPKHCGHSHFRRRCTATVRFLLLTQRLCDQKSNLLKE